MRTSSGQAARIRLHASRLINRLLLGSTAGDLPHHYCRSIVERKADPAISERLVEVEMRSEATIESYDMPEDFPLTFRRTKAFDERFRYRLSNVRLNADNGFVWIPGSVFFAESHGSMIRSLGWGDVRGGLVEAAHPLAEEVIPFPATGYFHWLLEVVPTALDALRFAPDAKLLVPSNAPGYVKECAVELVGARRVVYASGNVDVSGCVLSSIEPYSGFVRRSDVFDIQQKLSLHVESGSRMVYISRRHSPRRSLGKEGRLESELSAIGFEILYLEQMSFHEQRAALRSAQFVVSPHGAGLANLVWCEDLRTVIEIFPLGNKNDCYARLSLILGARYHYLTAKESKSSLSGEIDLSEVLDVVSEAQKR